MVHSVNLAENLDRIDAGIQRFNLEIVNLQGQINEKQNEIRRLEGCRIAYEGIRDALGEVCYGNEQHHHVPPPVQHDEHHHHATPHDQLDEHHNHSNSHAPETSKPEVAFSEPRHDDSNDNLSLEQLYKKYRAV